MLSTIFIVSLLVLKVFCASRDKYSTGEDADKLCKAYKKVCPVGKVCVIQNLYWPRKMAFPVCVHEREVPAKSKICELPPSPGGCAARFSRWYFNVHTKECSPLTYSGCEGNLNNFYSKEKCEEICEVSFTPDGIPPESIPLETTSPQIAPPEIVNIGINSNSNTPDVMAAPAPLRLQSADMRQALEFEESERAEMENTRKLRRKHRRGQRKINGQRRRRRRRQRKHRRNGTSSSRFGELRGRKTSFISAPTANNANTNGSKFLLRKLRRRQRKLANARRYSGYDGYYDKIKLFTLLGGGHRKRANTQA
ncbi:hypothetical protein SNE40_009072 [Patella caerulea]|uniref:BPTI/Kunitz inhibitor domain-containing protein n=1 Tax=Patella caerulea TaxID=87958 RepID=A0AAN8JQC4_PATCE